MTQTHYRQLWAVIGVTLALLCLNTWSYGQGGSTIFDIKLLHDHRVPAALMAAVICPVLLILLARIGMAHARDVDGTDWATRLPVFWLDGLDMTHAHARLYQQFFLVLFVIFPLTANLHFLRLVMNAPTFRTEGCTPLTDFDVLEPLSAAFWNNAFRIGDLVESGSCEGTATWFPVVGPVVLWFLFALSLASVFSLSQALRKG